MSVAKQLTFHSSQWLPSTVWLPIILQIIRFCVQQKKETHTGLEQLGQLKDDRIFIFGSTIPLTHLYNFQNKLLFLLKVC